MFIGSLAQSPLCIVDYKWGSIISISVHISAVCVAPKCRPSSQLMWPDVAGAHWLIGSCANGLLARRE